MTTILHVLLELTLWTALALCGLLCTWVGLHLILCALSVDDSQ